MMFHGYVSLPESNHTVCDREADFQQASWLCHPTKLWAGGSVWFSGPRPNLMVTSVIEVPTPSIIQALDIFFCDHPTCHLAGIKPVSAVPESEIKKQWQQEQQRQPQPQPQQLISIHAYMYISSICLTQKQYNVRPPSYKLLHTPH